MSKLDGRRVSLTGEFEGHPIVAANGNTIIFLPGDGSDVASWRYGRIAGTATKTLLTTTPLPVRSYDAYAAGFINRQVAYVVTDDQIAVISLSRRKILATLAETSTVSIPRLNGSALAVIQQIGGGGSVIAWRLFSEK